MQAARCGATRRALQRHTASPRSALARWRAWLFSTLEATTCWNASNRASTPAAPTKPGAKGASRSHHANEREAKSIKAGCVTMNPMVLAPLDVRRRTGSPSGVGAALQSAGQGFTAEHNSNSFGPSHPCAVVKRSSWRLMSAHASACRAAGRCRRTSMTGEPEVRTKAM